MAFKNRIIRRDTVDPSEVNLNERNWRIHTPEQVRALRAILGDVGWVTEVIWNERTGRLIDGEARIKLALESGEAEVPRTVVDLSEEEERLVLATFDPLSAMAATNWEALEKLIEGLPDIARLWTEHNEPENIEGHWQGMPSYTSEDKSGIHITVHFETEEDVAKFAEVIAQKCTAKTKSIWFPKKDKKMVAGVLEYSDAAETPDLHHLEG